MKAELKRLEKHPEEQLDDERYSILAEPMSNIDIYANYEVDGVVKKEYDHVPEVAMHVVEVLIVTGMCRTMRRMQLAVHAETGEMLSPEVIKYHLSLNKDKLESQRANFSDRQRKAVWAQLQELAEDPNGVRYQRMATDMAILIERDIAACVESPIIIRHKDVNGMLDSIKKLMDTDPLYTRKRYKEEKATKRNVARAEATNRVDDVMDRLAEYEKTKDDDSDFSDLQEYTKEIVERSAGAEYNAEPQDSGTGEERGEHEGGDGLSKESA